jgi:signal transduction histidine kinase
MMSNAARSLSHGDFSKRVYCKGDDEIAELAKSFNQMTDSLVQLESMRRSFVANVSHELRTPMTTIGGFIDGILDGTIPPEKHGYYLSIVSDEVKRLTRVVQSMLSLSRLESGEQEIKKTEIDIYRTVCEVLISQEKQIVEKNISVIGLEDYEKILLTADKDLLYQVVFNLIDNAIKYSNDGGSVLVDCHEEEHCIHVRVSDTGVGIPEQDIDRVKEKFFKSNTTVRGSGIGLAVADEIVKQHNGLIFVESKEGVGTTVTVVLPIADVKETAETEPEASASSLEN